MIKAEAVVFTAPNTVEYRDGSSHWVNCPDPGPGDVVVRVTHSWISNGTEGSFLRGERIKGDTAYRPGDPWPFPLVPGYQKIGIIEWVGEEVPDLKVGETVFCAMGNVKEMFMDRGGHVSPSVSARTQVWKLPQDVDPIAFAGLVLTQVGYNCGTRAPIEIGESAVVVGDGMVGQWAAQTLAWRGARVILVGHHDDRLALFAPRPFRHGANSKDTAWIQTVRDLAPDGVQVVVDTAGSVSAVKQLLDLMNRYGHIVSAGFYGTDDTIALQQLRDSELSIDLVSGWSIERMDRTRDLIAAGYLETLPLITHHLPVNHVADAWQMISEKDESVLGVILDW